MVALRSVFYVYLCVILELSEGVKRPKQPIFISLPWLVTVKIFLTLTETKS